MKRYATFALLALLLAGFAAAQTAASPPAPGTATKPALNIRADTAFLARLTTNLDLQQCTPGEPVEAQTTQDVKQGKEVVLKKGSSLLGHVTSVELASPAQPDTKIGIIFDGVKAKNGPEQSLRLLISALAPENEGPANSTLSEGRGMPGATTAATVPGSASAGGGVSGQLNTSSVGVSGFPGVRLGTLKASDGQVVTLVAYSKGEVKFKKGTQLVLKVVGQ